MRRGVLLATAGLLLGAAAGAAPSCAPDPLQGRAVYLRGTFNGWGAPEAHRFVWACNRWQLVARLDGEHSFKLGDEAWSADTDHGSVDGLRLVPKGPEIKRRFAGTYRFTVTMNQTTPELRIESCPVGVGGPPLGLTVLFLRGTPNNWAAQDAYAFQYSCDAYHLNVQLSGRHEFRIADAGWKDAGSIDAPLFADDMWSCWRAGLATTGPSPPPTMRRRRAG